MKKIHFAFLLIAFLSPFLLIAQGGGAKIKITGKVIEKTTKQSLEYATVTFFTPNTTTPIAGGITDVDGNFEIEVNPGIYDIKIEFISFSVSELNQQNLTKDTNLGTIALADDAMMLNEVVVRAESTTVDIKLDKKVYNVGQDLMVKGGTVSDVLDNIPSVTVDAEGAVALRGNENVRILIDGRPSNAINITEALRMIPADAIEKVEVITNPSARYESEGGGGIINIILKKGKNQGLNGTFIASGGDPESYGFSGNLNYKTENFNLFTNIGYNYRTNPGLSTTETRYLDQDDNTTSYVDERRESDRLSKSFNTNFGMEWYLDKSITWTNQLRIRRSSGDNHERVYFNNYDANRDFQFTNTRFSRQDNHDIEAEYSTNFVKKFKKEGHTLTIDGAFATERDTDFANINDGLEINNNREEQSENKIRVNYVLPIGEDSQFEAGYSGDFNKQTTYFSNFIADEDSSEFEGENTLRYRENINALYAQYGTKFNKFSVLLGMRWEDTNIDIDQLTINDFNNKKYDNFNPSVFLTYELSDESSVSLSYSRRISRPRGRWINPFPNRSSNINIFMGNPDLDAAMSNSFDLGYLTKWRKLTLSTSMYLNHTTDAFQFIRRESGDFVTTEVDGVEAEIPVIISTPINLATEYRFGFEFTLNYSPYKWWRLNSNFNFFRNEVQGDYTYIDFNDQTITQNFDNTAYSWFTRLTSKVTLPYAIEWQTNVTYNGPQTTAQGKSYGVASANLAFSKDVLKDKATIALSIQDVFNSRKRIYDTYIPGRLESHSEMQWRPRSVNLSFTYRFNKPKNERERQPQRDNDNGDEMFPG